MLSVATPTVPLRYLVASIAAHGLLAATPMGGPALPPEIASPLALRVDLRQAASPMPPPLAETPAPRRPSPVQRPAPRTPDPLPARLAIATPVPAAETAAPADPSLTASPDPNAPPQTLEPPLQLAHAASTVDLAPLRSGPSDFHLLALYTRQLGERVNRARHYPPLARVRGWQGTTVLDVTIGAAGEVVALSVANSSGFAILDEQAMRMVRESQPLPAPRAGPESLPLLVQLPITFSLR